MSAPLGPGDYVECVDASLGEGLVWMPGEAPIQGALYTVSAIFTDVFGIEVLEFKELKRSENACAHYGGRLGYGRRRFKPIYKRDEKLFRQLEVPVEEFA